MSTSGSSQEAEDLLQNQARFLRDMDRRISAKLDEELSRNDRMGTVVDLDIDTAHGMLFEHHLLWTDVANTTRSSDEIVKRFRRGMAWTRRAFEVRGLLLFFEIDRDFTTLEEVNYLKERLGKLAGDVDPVFCVRVRDSFIKSLTCRAILVGGMQDVKYQSD